MTLREEFNSWFAPQYSETNDATSIPSVPRPGTRAPRTDLFRRPNALDAESEDDAERASSDQDPSDTLSPTTTTTTTTAPTTTAYQSPAVLLFLRHCGCPFAEKSYLNFRQAAKNHKDLAFVAVSQSDWASTRSWLAALPQSGSEPRNLRVVVDGDPAGRRSSESRDETEQRSPYYLFTAFGLGTSSFNHLLAPAMLYRTLRLGLDEGIWGRPTHSGSRWQMGGAFALDTEGIVRWGGAAQRADVVADFEAAVRALRSGNWNASDYVATQVSR